MNRDDFDEYFNLGGLEIGRKGTETIVKNNLSKEDIEKNNQVMAGEYDSIKAEIDNQIKCICDDIKKCNPLHLLLTAYHATIPCKLNAFSEFLISKESNHIMKSVEYIQSVLASQKHDYSNNKVNDELERETVEKVAKLYSSMLDFYPYWAAKATITNNNLSSTDIHYIVESQYMSYVRGKRYQFQQITSVGELLFPHSDEMEKVYGISAEFFLDGLKKLEYSLSGEILEPVHIND